MRSKRRYLRACSVVLAMTCAILVLLSTVPAGPALFKQIVSKKATPVGDSTGLLQAIQRSENVELQEDIDMSGSEFSSITSPITIDGQGHLIIGLTAPLFDEISSGITVQNLGLSASQSFSASGTSCGLLARSMVGGTVQNCFAVGTISYQNENGAVGGLIGSMSGGTLSGSFACVSLSGKAAYVGGLIGSMSGGSVTSCYSSGDISATAAYTAGLLNRVTDTASVSDTYTSCQLRTLSPNAKPSGADGLYDNQLSVLRESLENSGVNTRALMSTDALSTAFTVTSTSYPLITAFYTSSWSAQALSAVRVSVAAAVFSDVQPTTRKEPPGSAFFARADYLTRDVYVDRTHGAGFTWDFSSSLCTQYDTVPLTQTTTGYVMGASPDLLRARFKFSGDVQNEKMTVCCGGFSRSFYLSAYAQNPYFAGGSGTPDDPFLINNETTLSNVRYYTMLDAANYRLNNTIENISDFDPIDHFRGTFDGDGNTIQNVTLANDGAQQVGLFGDLHSDAVIKDLSLHNVEFSADLSSSNPALTAGCLAGSADGAIVQNVVLSGNNVIHAPVAGGLIGSAGNTTVTECLVSIEAVGKSGVGGLIGDMNGGTLEKCGVTGLIAGETCVGGLIGKTDTASGVVKDCYSTAPVFASGEGQSVYAGGLIGKNTNMTLSYCYTAGMVVGKSTASSCGVIVGSGSVDEACLADGDATGATGAAQLTAGSAPAAWASHGGWTYVAGKYPQLTAFAQGSAPQFVQNLSAFSVNPVVYQQNWQDGSAADMTTGWFSTAPYTDATLNYDKYDGYSDGITFKNDVEENVCRFEANAEATEDRLLTVKLTDAQGNLRASTATRNGLIALTYTVDAPSGVRTYLELMHKTDDAAYTGTQLMNLGNSAAKKLYDIASDSMLKVRVEVPDGFAATVTAQSGGTEVVLTETDGVYTSPALTQDVCVTVTVTSSTEVPWGVHRDTK